MKVKSLGFWATSGWISVGTTLYTLITNRTKRQFGYFEIPPDLQSHRINFGQIVLGRARQLIIQDQAFSFCCVWSIIWFTDTRMHVCVSHRNTALGCQFFIILCSWFKCVCDERGGCWESWEAEGKKDKPLANIAACSIIIISGNFTTSTCGSKQQAQYCAHKKLLVFWTCVRHGEHKNKAGMLLTPKERYEEEWIQCKTKKGDKQKKIMRDIRYLCKFRDLKHTVRL